MPLDRPSCTALYRLEEPVGHHSTNAAKVEDWILYYEDWKDVRRLLKALDRSGCRTVVPDMRDSPGKLKCAGVPSHSELVSQSSGEPPWNARVFRRCLNECSFDLDRDNGRV